MKGRSGPLFDLRRQLAFYGAYHSHPINQLIHLVFVPLILWSVAVWLGYSPVLPINDVEVPLFLETRLPPKLATSIHGTLIFNGSFILLAAYSLYYVILDPIAGTAWMVLVGMPLWSSANAVRMYVPHAWAWAIGAHVLGWFMQIYFGHALAEKRRPALLDSFFQSLALAPLFVFFEVLFLLGYRPRLYKDIKREVDEDIKRWKLRKAMPQYSERSGCGGLKEE